VWNRYLAETGDLDGLPLMPLFLSCRAAVRAKTSATAAGLQGEARRREELQDAARTYLAMAEALLDHPRPTLIAIGGLSGSGKSTLARGLAPSVGAVPGAVVHRSDDIRKQLCGSPLLERLGPDGYSPEVTDRVYATMAERAAQTIQGGFSTIVDAVYARASERLAIARVAADLSVRFVGLWLDAPESTLIARAEARRQDPSDANAAVIRHQLRQETGLIDWHHIDASPEAGRILEEATAVCR